MPSAKFERRQRAHATYPTALGALLLMLATSFLRAAEVPESYRSTYQLIAPLNAKWAVTAVGSFASTPSTPGAVGRSSFLLVPAGVEYRFDANWSAQSYLLMNRDSFRDGLDKLEIRPVAGLSYRARLSDVVEVGAWLRYEARFLDVSGNETFQSRLRLRPHIDYKFGTNPGKAGSWHLRTEYEPRYVDGNGSSFFNGQQVRLTLGYKVSERLMVDFRVARDWTRNSSSADFSPTNDSFTLQFNYTFLPSSSADAGPTPEMTAMDVDVPE